MTILLENGSASFPSLTFLSSGGNGSGAYLKSAGVIGLVINGTEIGTLSSTGLSVTGLATSANVSVTGKLGTPSADVASAATIAAMASATSLVLLTGSTATDLQGIAAGTLDGQVLRLINKTGANLTIRHQSASAAAGNKITTMTGADITTTANGAAEFIYSVGDAVWYCMFASA